MLLTPEEPLHGCVAPIMLAQARVDQPMVYGVSKLIPKLLAQLDPGSI